MPKQPAALDGGSSQDDPQQLSGARRRFLQLAGVLADRAWGSHGLKRLAFRLDGLGFKVWCAGQANLVSFKRSSD